MSHVCPGKLIVQPKPLPVSWMIEFQYSTRFGRYQKLILSCYFMNIPCRYHRSNGFFHSCRWKQWGLLKLSMCQVVKFMICGLPIPRIFPNTTARWFAGILIVSRFSNLIPSPFWPFILPLWIVQRSVVNQAAGYKFLGLKVAKVTQRLGARMETSSKLRSGF